jgi:hypothetical protein
MAEMAVVGMAEDQGHGRGGCRGDGRGLGMVEDQGEGV